MKPDKSCTTEIERMLKNSQTKVIAPVITLGLLREYSDSKKTNFSDSEIRKAYEKAVREMKAFLGHDVHIGAKYYDAYGSRMSRYSVLESAGHLNYQLLPPYTEQAATLCEWIPQRIKQHIDKRLGIVPLLHELTARVALAERQERFVDLICGKAGRP